MDEKYILDSVAELRELFRPWADNARKIASMFQAEPSSLVLSSDALMKRVGSDASQAVATMAEYVSGRMSIIKANVLGRATALPPKIEPAVHVSDKVQQEEQRNLFQFLHGIHNVLNAEEQEAALGTSWDHSVLDSLLTYGVAASMPHLVDVDGVPEFSAEILDPTGVYYDIGHGWPRRCVREMMKSTEDAKATLLDIAARSGGKFTLSQDAWAEFFPRKEKDPPPKAVTFTEFWLVSREGGKKFAVDRAVLINGKLAGQYRTTWDRQPFVIQTIHAASGSWVDFSGGFPSGVDVQSTRGISSTQVLRHARSVFAPLYYINQQYLQYMSTLMEGLARAMNPGEESIIDPTSGEEPPDKQHRGPGSHDVHGPGRQTKIQEQATAQIGEAARIFSEKVDAEFNRLAPEVLFGQSNPGDSGYLQVIKVSHAAAVFQETVKGASAFEKRVFDQFVHQFKRASLTFKVDGWWQKGKTAPQFFEGGDFGVKDLPDQYVINVEWLTDYASNDAAKLEQYLAGVGKAFSARQGRANILGDDDPELTQRLIDQENYEAMPAIQQIRMLYDLRQEIEAVEAAARKEKNPKLAFELLLQAGFLKKEYALAAGIQAGAQPGQETAPPGMSSSTMPPEMGVGTNPDRNAQAKGRVSSFTGGKPRLAEVA